MPLPHLSVELPHELDVHTTRAAKHGAYHTSQASWLGIPSRFAVLAAGPERLASGAS